MFYSDGGQGAGEITFIVKHVPYMVSFEKVLMFINYKGTSCDMILHNTGVGRTYRRGAAQRRGTWKLPYKPSSVQYMHC